jgi:hypothetical protein
MSTGETSSLLRRASELTGAPDAPLVKDPTLKPMRAAELAFRPSAPPRTGSQPALKPKTGSQPAFKPAVKTDVQPAFKPQVKTDVQPAFKPQVKTDVQPAFVPPDARPARPPGSRTGSFPAPPPREPPPEAAPAEEEHPVFDAEKLQRQIRAMSLTDSALGRAAQAQRPVPRASAAAAPEDTFTKKKMRQAEINMPDFDLDEDLG